MAAVHGAAWFAISVDVHSCTLSPEMWRGIEVRPFHLPLPQLSCMHLPNAGGEGRNVY
jgi:hypothetical protein